jgi:hypothetical protein
MHPPSRCAADLFLRPLTRYNKSLATSNLQLHDFITLAIFLFPTETTQITVNFYPITRSHLRLPLLHRVILISGTLPVSAKLAHRASGNEFLRRTAAIAISIIILFSFFFPRSLPRRPNALFLTFFFNE